MKNKKLLSLSILCCSSFLLFGCTTKKNDDGPTEPVETYYTVTFMNGDVVFDTKQALANDVVERPSSNPQKDDFDFVGWYTEVTEGVKWVFETDVVTKDMTLYAHFESSQVNYSVNLLLNGEIQETKTTDSKSQNDVTLSAVAVGDGNSLLGWGIETGTTAEYVDYRVGTKLTYEEVVELADENNTVNLNAIVKEGEIVRLNIALWTRYADKDCVERVIDAFEKVVTTKYDFIDYTAFEPAESSGDEYYSVANFASGVASDASIGVAFPTGNNFASQASVADLVKENVSLGVAIKNAKGENDSDTSRYVARLSDNAIDVEFVNWLKSDDGKVVLNSDYVPSTEHGEASSTKLVLGVWGRFLPSDTADGVVDAFKTYATSQGVSYESVSVEYYDSTNYNGKATYLGAAKDDLSLDVLLPVSKAIAKATDSDIDDTFKTKFNTALNLGETDGDDVGLGLTVGGSSNRWLVTLNADSLTESFVSFCQTEEGKKALDPTYGVVDVIDEEQTTLTISYYGKFISESNATIVTNAIKSYFDSESISYTSIVSDYVDATTGNNNKNYASNMSKDADISLCGASALASSLSNVTTYGDLGTVQGQDNRMYYAFNNGELTLACIKYLTSTAGQTLLPGLTA